MMPYAIRINPPGWRCVGAAFVADGLKFIFVVNINTKLPS